MARRGRSVFLRVGGLVPRRCLRARGTQPTLVVGEFVAPAAAGAEAPLLRWRCFYNHGRCQK